MLENQVLECPKCKKHGFVRLHSDSDIFECVYCHYKDDLTKGFNAKPVNFGIFWAVLAAIVVVLAIMG
jgi:ribosomal protein L37AE/L43A